jgi:hypothetical protein
MTKHIASLFTQNSRLRLFAFITLLAAAVISFTSLRDLAAYAGFGSRAWLLPLCVDAVAALGMEVWLSGSMAWKSGRNLAMVAIVGSLAGNGGDWWIKSASFLSAGLGLVPPAALAAVLVVLHRHWARTGQVAAPTVTRKAVKAAAPVFTPAPAAAEAAVTATPKTVTKSQPVQRPAADKAAPIARKGDEEKVAQLVAHARVHGLPTRREAQALFREWNGVGVGTDPATRLIAQAQAVLTEEPVEFLPEPVQLRTVPVRDESNSDSARQEARL